MDASGDHTAGRMPATGSEVALTVREVLAMPAFAQARLVAGASGADAPVDWVHIIDMPDAGFDWGRAHVLVLTAGYGIGSAQEQRSLVRELASRHFAGLVLSLGYAVNEVPDALREAADEHGLALITTPPHVLFITLTEAVFSELMRRQHALLHRAGEVRSLLTDLVLRGGGLDDAAATLAGLLRRSVTIEDTSFRVLATARHGPVDEARERSVAAGRTSPQMARHLVDMGLYRDLLVRMGPVRVPPLPELGMTMERVVAPIIVDRDLHGYIWVIAGEAPLTDLDELAISHGATIAALILLRERAVLDAATSLRGDLVHQLLSPHPSIDELSDRAAEVGVALDRSHQVLLLRPPDTVVTDGTATLTERVARWLAVEEPSALVARRPEGVVVIVPADDPARGEVIAHRLIDDLAADPLLIGVGPPAVPGRDNGGLRDSHRDAREAVEIHLALGDTHGVRPARALGLLRWLAHVPDEVLHSNPYLAAVAELAADDTGHEPTRTLEAYLAHGGATAATARALHLHRNTLLHRLQRLEERLGLDLRDPRTRLELHAAVQARRLRGG